MNAICKILFYSHADQLKSDNPNIISAKDILINGYASVFFKGILSLATVAAAAKTTIDLVNTSQILFATAVAVVGVFVLLKIVTYSLGTLVNFETTSLMYEGGFKDNKFNGQGKITYSNGNVYEGEFRNNKLNGQGKITVKSGPSYKGEFKDDELNGQGEITFYGSTYKGEFKNNELNGLGKVTLMTGEIYEGSFKNNELNGQGKISIKGGVLEGEFKNSKLNGLGKIIHADGTIEERTFENGKLVI